MASRPTRPPPPPPTSTTSQHGTQFTTRDHSSSAPPRRPSHNTTRLPGRGIPSYPVNADSSSDDDDVIIPARTSKRGSLHSRSMSHPITSLFSSKKKKAADNLDHVRNEVVLGSDDDYRRQPQPSPRAQPSTPRKDSRGPMDFNTGNYCASTRQTNDYLTPSQPIQGPGASTSKGPSKPNPGYNEVFDDFADLALEPNPLSGEPSELRSYSTSFPEARSSMFPPALTINQDSTTASSASADLDIKKVFKEVEEYLVLCFNSHSCINKSFVTRRLSVSSKHPPEPAKKRTPETRKQRLAVPDDAPPPELDPKLLLVGDFAENGAWWTGGREETHAPTRVPSRRRDDHPSIVNSRSPRIDWGVVTEWYRIIINSAESWHDVYEEMVRLESLSRVPDPALRQFETMFLSAQGHLQRTLLKCTEVLLKRPGRPLVEPQDVRFLLILLANPLLTPGTPSHTGRFQHLSKGKATARGSESERQAKSIPGRHSGIIKRVLGLLANSPEQCHQYLIVWLSKLPEYMFLQMKDLIASFVTYRLTRVSEKTVEGKVDMTGGLVPEMPNARSANTPASLHAALAASKSNKKDKQAAEPKRSAYTDDWQIKAGAKVMALVFAANNLTHVRRNDGFDGRNHGHLLATSDFYNSLVDCLDFKDDFEMWESKTSKFSFCQYPFFLSIWAKIAILEHDAKRQMRGKARDAFFDSILNHKMYAQHLLLHIRRECLVDDSLKRISEVVGSGSEDIKKALRIEFKGEEGVDAGGLRKEWFLLLVREVFNPDHGLFDYDEDSQFCYFNSNSFETTDQFFLVGVVLGLAIYNSTILDVALPPFAFRKLLASSPIPAVGTAAHPRPTMNYTLDDLAEYRPALARGLRQLLDYEGDVQTTFCIDFVIEVERYGERVKVPLLAGGESRMVTNANRREYVDLYVRYLLDTSVTRQFEPFKRGFFTVCGGNALSLFRPEEIELLVRGSDEPLDILSIKGSTEYTNWPAQQPPNPAKDSGGNQNNNNNNNIPFTPEAEPTLRWFWTTFERAPSQDQRRLLSFITGSDRIPATGAASLVIRVNCLGPDEGRFPTARTCFNQLSLYRCRSRERLEAALWRAVHESEGFGLR